MKNFLLVITFLCFPLFCQGVEKNNYYLTPYAGVFDVFDKKNYALVGGEFRGKKFYNYVVPKLGGYITEKNSAYGYVGFNLDFPIYEKKVFLIPGFAVGAYSKGNKGKRLGGTLEFRSSIELAYMMKNDHRIGIALSHISNANIYKKNPGAEDLVVTYSIPMNF